MTPEDLRSQPGQSPEERAEKVVLRWNQSDSPKLSELIAAEMEAYASERVEEAQRVPCLSPECQLQAFSEGKQLAYEEVLKSDSYRMNIWKAAQASAYKGAAKLFERMGNYSSEEIQRTIRARAAEVK